MGEADKTIHTVDPSLYTVRKSWADYEQRPIFYVAHPDLGDLVAQFWSKREAQAWIDKKKQVSKRKERVSIAPNWVDTIREVKQLPGPLKVADEGEENIYFSDADGERHFFKYGTEANKSAFYKIIRQQRRPNPGKAKKMAKKQRTAAQKAATKITPIIRKAVVRRTIWGIPSPLAMPASKRV
ncbi:hypothetical protein LCGC14_2798290 [marine sediment metagenome]|uniref:Uncharacterized protein n=1 Tax=marine sediment metagenome TaxID=412755 RepID=A0A0F8YNG6_9ZZZZ